MLDRIRKWIERNKPPEIARIIVSDGRGNVKVIEVKSKPKKSKAKK